MKFRSFFFVCEDVCIKFPPPTDIFGVLPNIQKVVLGLFPSRGHCFMDDRNIKGTNSVLVEIELALGLVRFRALLVAGTARLSFSVETLHSRETHFKTTAQAC